VAALVDQEARAAPDDLLTHAERAVIIPHRRLLFIIRGAIFAMLSSRVVLTRVDSWPRRGSSLPPIAIEKRRDAGADLADHGCPDRRPWSPFPFARYRPDETSSELSPQSLPCLFDSSQLTARRYSISRLVLFSRSSAPHPQSPWGGPEKENKTPGMQSGNSPWPCSRQERAAAGLFRRSRLMASSACASAAPLPG